MYTVTREDDMLDHPTKAGHCQHLRHSSIIPNEVHTFTHGTCRCEVWCLLFGRFVEAHDASAYICISASGSQGLRVSPAGCKVHE